MRVNVYSFNLGAIEDMQLKRILVICCLILNEWTAIAEERPVSDPNPFINLFLQRVIVAEATIKIAEAKLKYEQTVLDMYNKLNEGNSGAISYQDILSQQALVRIAEANLEQAKAILGKDDALWRLAKFRVAAGEEMPICVN